MLTLLVVAVVFAGLGFGAGRIKNAAKLAAIKAELVKVENLAVTDVEKAVAAALALKAKLGL